MQFTPEHYYRTANERMIEAGVLYERERYGISMYVSGLAVECLLRAFRSRKDPIFDSRHDLRVLFRESGILRFYEDNLERRGQNPDQIDNSIAKFAGAHDVVVRLWRNDYRFAAQAQIRGWLNSLGAYHGVKGDVLKANARRMIGSAQIIIDTGVLLWTSKKK